jgi:hypothetical protein
LHEIAKSGRREADDDDDDEGGEASALLSRRVLRMRKQEAVVPGTNRA